MVISLLTVTLITVGFISTVIGAYFVGKCSTFDEPIAYRECLALGKIFIAIGIISLFLALFAQMFLS